MAKKTIAQLEAELRSLRSMRKQQQQREGLEDKRDKLKREIKEERLKLSPAHKLLRKASKSKTLKKIGRKIREFQPGDFEI